jgi:hypothetical protein
VVSTDPTGGHGAWTVTAIDPGNALTSVACPTTGKCFLGDDSGNVLTGVNSGVPRAAAIAALTRVLDGQCRTITRHGCVARFDASGPGTIAIDWAIGHHLPLPTARARPTPASASPW